MAVKLITSPMRILDIEFTDVDELCSTVRSWDLDFRPLSSPKPCEAIGHIVQSRCGPFEFGYARLSSSIEQHGTPPAGLLTFAVPEKRMRRLWWRGHDVARDSVLVYPVGSELFCLSGPDFEVHTISVSEDTVASVCENLKIALPHARARPEVFYPPRNHLITLRERLCRIRDHDHPEPATVAKQIVEELIVAWLKQPNALPRRRPSIRARDCAIRRCLEHMEQSDWAYLTPGALCEVGGISERTLQYAFRERFDLSPAAFIKARRLTAVRQKLLLTNGEDSNVGDIATAFGFWHVGQFASDYRQMFGETPTATLGQSNTDR